MKHNKKLTLLALAGLSTLVFSTSNVYAASTGVITAETVRMRASATTSSKIVRDLDEDAKVDILEKDGDWYKVSFKGSEGYVYGKYVKVSGDLKETTNEEKNTEEQKLENNETKVEEQTENKQEETIVKEEVVIDSIQELQQDCKLYALPLISSNNKKVEKGTQVTILQSLNNWVYVSADNSRGWITKQNLKTSEKTEETATNNEETVENVEENTAEDPANNVETSKIGYINVENANVRVKATTDSEHLTTLTLNKKVTILSEENNWYKIKVGSKEGYVYKKLVSSEKVKEPTSRSSEDRTLNNKSEEDSSEKTSNVTNTNSVSESTDATGASIVEYAKQYLGSSYVSGGNGPNSFDCSGFTSYVYKHFGYSLSRTSSGQASNGTEVSDLQQGDIVVFLNHGKTKVGHVGIYIGGNTFIHAANPSKGVITESMSSSYYSDRYVGARRIIE